MHELRYYNLEAPQLDEQLRPAEPSYRLVLVGGEGPEGDPDPSQWLQAYDPKLHGWGRLGDMGVQRRFGCGAAAVGSRLYAFGGQVNPALAPGSMTSYNMATKRVKYLAKPPRALQYCAGVACDGCLYSVGGRGEGAPVADVYAYNPDTDSWMAGPALPSALWGMAAAEHMGAIYACGGRPAGDTPSTLLMLDPRTRAWASLPTMPTPTAHAGVAAVSDRMYVPGGNLSSERDATGNVSRVPILQCYDVAAGRWDTGCLPMSVARAGLGAAALHGEVWVVGGVSRDGQPLSSVEIFNPRLNTWRPSVSLPYATDLGRCTVVQLSG